MRRVIRAFTARALALFGKGGGVMASAFWSGLSGSTQNWHREAGVRYDNSAVCAIIQYFMRQLTGDPRLVVQRQVIKGGKVEWAEVPHDMVRVMARGPMTDDQMLGGVILSLVAFGNAYLVKDRSVSGRLNALVYVPTHQMVAVNDRNSPFGDRAADGTHLVTFYEYRSSDGRIIPFRVEDVVHFRWGVDPMAVRYGLSPIWSVLREVATDNNAATLGAALLANAGIPGVAISPKTEVAGQLTPDQKEALNEKFRRRVTGDMAGAPFISPFPVDYTIIGFSPDKLVLNETRALAVTRICAPFGIDPMVLGFPSETKTYSNFEEAARNAWRSACKPIARLISDTLYNQVLRVDYPIDSESARVYWDFSEVAEEQENITQEAERLRKLFMADAITRSDLRAALGYEVDDSRDNVFYSAQKPQVASNPKADGDGKGDTTRAVAALVAQARALEAVAAIP